MVIDHVFVAGCLKNFGFEKSKTPDVDTVFTRKYFTEPSRHNRIFAENTDLLLNTASFTLNTPAFLPQSGSPLLEATNAGFTYEKLANADKSAIYRSI